MREATKIFSEPWDRNRRLAEMGLTEEILLEAVRRGLAALAACTPNHPISFPGTSFWAEAIRAIADQLAPGGWRRKDETGQPLIVNPKGTLAITVATGDERTGMRGESTPRTKSGKGPRTVDAVQINAGWLFEELEQDEKNRRERQTRNTWILLMYWDAVAGVARSELSRPVSLDQQGRIDDWSERIILGSISFDDGARVRKDGDGGGEPPKSGEIIVEIKRRA